MILGQTGILDATREALTFEYLKDTLADHTIVASAPQFRSRSFDESKRCEMRMRASDYIDYVLNPSEPPIGTWQLGSWQSLQALGMPLYCGTLDPFRAIPKTHAFWTMFHASPTFAADWSRWLPPFYRTACWQERMHHYIYLAAPGALTPLHFDFWDTHAYLYQVNGLKYCVLFSPTDSDNIYRGEIDPGALDLSRHPKASNATAWVGILEPGQTLFIPSRWWHYVVTLTTSLTLSYDWFDATNCMAYLRRSFPYVLRRYANRLREAAR